MFKELLKVNNCPTGKKIRPIWSHWPEKEAALRSSMQGDQIGRIFAFWAMVYFGHFLF
jgi:hypothetical protein